MKSSKALKEILQFFLILFVCAMTVALFVVCEKTDCLLTFKIPAFYKIKEALRADKGLMVMLVAGLLILFYIVKINVNLLDNIKNARNLLIIAVTISFGIVYLPYIFGGHYYLFKDMGMDTVEQFYPMYIYMITRIKEANLSLWNFEWGLGLELFARQEWIMDPCGWITIASGLLFGEKSVRYVLLFLQFIKMLLAALLCYRFLGYYSFSDKARAVASYLYAFSGWILLWGQHYYFGMAYVYLMLLMVAVENALSEIAKKNNMARAYTFIGLSVFVIFVYSVYFGYMIILFASVYTIFRIGFDRQFFVKLWPLIITVLLGMAMALVMIVPYADIVLNVSTRVSGSFLERIKEYIFALFESSYYLEIMGRFISNNSMGILGLDQQYYELAQLSFSMMNVTVLSHYVWYAIIKNNEKLKGRLKRGVVVLLAVLSVTYPLIGSIFNIGGAPVYRFTFVLMPLMAVIYAYFVDECVIFGKINTFIAIAGFVIVYAVIYAGFNSHSVNYHFVSTNIILINFVFMIFLIMANGQKRKYMKFLVCLLMVLSACYEGYVSNNLRNSFTNKDVVMTEDFNGAKTRQALVYIKDNDDSFYRVEKCFRDLGATGESLLFNYAQLHMYCSTMSSYLSSFYNNIYPAYGENMILADFDEAKYNPVFKITNVKYFVSDNYLNLDDYTLIYSENNRYVYRYNEAVSIGNVYNTFVSYEDYEKLDEDMKYSILDNTLLVSSKDVEKMQSFKANGTANYTGEFKKNTDAYVTGTVKTDKDTILLLSIPYSNYWNIYIDGEKCDKINADYAFMAVEVLKGEHRVDIKYENPLYLYGLLGSVAGVLLMVSWILYIKNKKKEN